jgi:hypothetical protein
MITILALAGAAVEEIWHQWDTLTYDRTSVDAVAQSGGYLLATMAVAMSGFLVLLVVFNLSPRRSAS